MSKTMNVLSYAIKMMNLTVNIIIVDFTIKMLIQIHDYVSNYYHKIMINMIN